MSFAPDSEHLAKPETMLRVPVGLASPLWGLFAGAAVSGAAWWWMTRWSRPQNLEALFGAAEPAVEPETAALAAPIDETVETVIEPLAQAAPEPAPEAVAEATPEPLMEAAIEATPEPVVEAPAEETPVLEALEPEIAEPVAAAQAAPDDIFAEPAPAPKARKKAAAPQLSGAPD